MSTLIIVGGGLNGATLALACAGAGLKVTLIDQTPFDVLADRDFDGRSYALALSSQQLLHALGLWDGLTAEPILNVQVTDGKAGDGPGPFMLELGAQEVTEGPIGYMVEDRHLRPELIKSLKENKNITLVTGKITAQEVKGPSARVTLETGEVLSAQLLVACDGKTSSVAERAGITRMGWEYPQTALVCAIQHEQPHNGTAHQFFLPAGPLAILPLTENRSSIVWSEKHAAAQAIMGLSDAEYIDVLRPRFGEFLGDITLSGKRFSYPLSLSVASEFHRDRIALVGDAAHAVHPIAGQGLNAGYKDIAALTEVLIDAHRRGEDIGRADVLARYQSWRRFDVMTLAAATDAFNRLFSNENAALRLVRDVGMGLFNSTASLRKLAIKEAAGLSGDLPKLLRGEPL